MSLADACCIFLSSIGRGAPEEAAAMLLGSTLHYNHARWEYGSEVDMLQKAAEDFLRTELVETWHHLLRMAELVRRFRVSFPKKKRNFERWMAAEVQKNFKAYEAEEIHRSYLELHEQYEQELAKYERRAFHTVEMMDRYQSSQKAKRGHG